MSGPDGAFSPTVTINRVNVAIVKQVPTVLEIVQGVISDVGAAVWDHVISGFKARTWLHWIMSFVALKNSGATNDGQPGSMTFRNIDDDDDIATVTHDGIGNRTNITLTDPEN